MDFYFYKVFNLILQSADFYQNKLGFKNLVLVKYGEYLNRPDRPEQQKIAQKHPERIMYGYFDSKRHITECIEKTVLV